MNVFPLLLVLVLACAPAVGFAQSVKKCVDPEGNVTFIQGDCPREEAQQDVEIHPENRNPHGELKFPEAAQPGLEAVWVASVLDDNNGGVIVRESGAGYVIETGLGCDSLWRYQESFAQVFAAGEFGNPGSLLLLPEHQQKCFLRSVKPISGSVDLEAIPRVPSTPPPLVATPRAPRPVVREARHSRPEVADEEACRSLRRRHAELNQRCRGLDECDRKRVAIEALQRRWAAGRCEGALGIGPY